MPTQMPRNGLPRSLHGLLERLEHAGHRVEAAHAIGKGADARQHDALGAATTSGSAVTSIVELGALLARGALERLARPSADCPSRNR